jgi:glycosyltransferase involved in cell wall biosynthesis
VRPQVLFVGRHRRDFATLGDVIRAAERLDPGVRFVIVTKSEAADSFREHANVVVKSHVTEPDLITLYRESAVVVQPMKESTANNAILEAMACGAPVVATDVGSTRDYVNDCCAVLTPPGDASSMVDALLELLHDTTKRERMGRAARERALDFSWPVIAARFSQLYASLI